MLVSRSAEVPEDTIDAIAARTRLPRDAAFPVESKASEPIIPLGVFRNRTVSLTVIASVQVAMCGGTVLLSQYSQVALGKSPTVPAC